MKVIMIMGILLVAMICGCVGSTTTTTSTIIQYENISTKNITSDRPLTSNEMCVKVCQERECMLDIINENSTHIQCSCYCSWVAPHEDNVWRVVIEK